MAATIDYLLGRHVTGVIITPQTYSSGTLADSTPVATMAGYVESISRSTEIVTEDIVAMDGTRNNPVKISVGTTYTITEILRVTNGNLAAAAAAAQDYMKFVFARGGVTATAYALVMGYTETLVRGKNTGALTIATVDIGSANPTPAG